MKERTKTKSSVQGQNTNKKTKPKPYIDYKTAGILARMYDFIIDANYERKTVYEELGYAIKQLQIIQKRLAPVDDPEEQFAHFNRDHFTHNIAQLRADAWEAGLTTTLFEKLKDREFRNRFIGFMKEPVTKEEIEDRYEDHDKEDKSE